MQVKASRLQEVTTINLFKTHHRFLRSTYLERDWDDPAALENYTFTTHTAQCLGRLTTGLRKSSSLRAWRITGDYGSGKSSFALLLANVLAKRLKHIPAALKETIRETSPELLKPSQPGLVPVFITGTRESLGPAILRALLRTLKEIHINGGFYHPLEQLLQGNAEVNDETVIEWIQKSHRHLVKTQAGDGLALILDEAGKFLEYAAIRPEQQDIYLLQRLGEIAARSGKEPFYIVSIFHQGIGSYAQRLSIVLQREWEKIAGRYEEILWHYPAEQIALLIANALDTSLNLVPKPVLASIKKDMERVMAAGWYGHGINQSALVKTSERLYPVHPTVIPVLVRLFSRFAQNERSLYSFLLGAEPFGLQQFTAKTNGKQLFRLADLYDYARSTFGTRLGELSQHWHTIDGRIQTGDTSNDTAMQLLKTVGVINLLNDDDLPASKEILLLAVKGDVDGEIARMEANHFLHYRGHAGGYRVWPNTSVNLKQAYRSAKKAIGEPKDVVNQLRTRLEDRPIVARRHYIETGNLRYFEVKYLDIKNMTAEAAAGFLADGLILVPLCESLHDVVLATAFAKKIGPDTPTNILVVIPSPLQELISYLHEVRIWEWIERSVGDLRHDPFGREEVSRRLQVSRAELENHLQAAIGLKGLSNETAPAWYHKGKLLRNITTGKSVMSLLSDICNATFTRAPRIHNELINRRELSSAGASARLRLCERLFEFSDQPLLGMDADKHPPEMSMYLSVLQWAGLHTQHDGRWGVSLPDEMYDAHHAAVLPAMQCIHEVLHQQSDKRVPVLAIFDALRAAPYGVRDGMTPLLLAVFAEIHEHELAFYEDGSFIARISGSNFLRLIKAPETFELQYYPISAVRNALFHRLVHELGLKASDRQTVDILDVVKPLMVFMAGLPEYALNTSQLTPQTQAVRTVLRTTVDPVRLIFHDLPKACDLDPINEKATNDAVLLQSFVERLKGAIDELRAAYPALLQYIQQSLAREFQLDQSFDGMRAALAARAQLMTGFITEINLKSFALRLADESLAKDAWLESLGNLVASMPPAKWRDRDTHKFDQEIHRLCSQLIRVEATLYQHTAAGQQNVSVRVALTRPNGEERDQVIHLTKEQAEKMINLGKQVKEMVAKHGQIGMAAASQALWEMMTTSEVNS